MFSSNKNSGYSRLLPIVAVCAAIVAGFSIGRWARTGSETLPVIDAPGDASQHVESGRQEPAFSKRLPSAEAADAPLTVRQILEAHWGCPIEQIGVDVDPKQWDEPLTLRSWESLEPVARRSITVMSDEGRNERVDSLASVPPIDAELARADQEKIRQMEEEIAVQAEVCMSLVEEAIDAQWDAGGYSAYPIAAPKQSKAPKSVYQYGGTFIGGNWHAEFALDSSRFPQLENAFTQLKRLKEQRLDYARAVALR